MLTKGWQSDQGPILCYGWAWFDQRRCCCCCYFLHWTWIVFLSSQPSIVSYPTPYSFKLPAEHSRLLRFSIQLKAKVQAEDFAIAPSKLSPKHSNWSSCLQPISPPFYYLTYAESDKYLSPNFLRLTYSSF